MLIIEKSNFEEKYTEINIRQRIYDGRSFVTLIINTEFYPSLVNDNIVNGNIEIKLDLENIGSLNDFVNKSYNGEIGKVTISVNNNGIWEHETVTNFKISFGERNGRNINFSLETDNCKLETNGVMVSLYSTSTDVFKLKEVFDLNDFYDSSIIKEVGSSKIVKYYVKQ